MKIPIDRSLIYVLVDIIDFRLKAIRDKEKLIMRKVTTTEVIIYRLVKRVKNIESEKQLLKVQCCEMESLNFTIKAVIKQKE